MRPRDPARSAQTAEALSGPLVKLLVRETGLHRVSASNVIARGIPGGTSISELHLFKRVYDVDMLDETAVDIQFRVVEDPAGVGGVLDGLDWVVFYGERLREDGFQEDPIEKFSYTNTYWLGTSGGSQMPVIDVPVGIVSADTATAVFPASHYLEQDNVFLEATPPNQVEFFYYDVEGRAALAVPFETHSIDPNGSLVLKARFQRSWDTRHPESYVLNLSIVNSKGTAQLPTAEVLNSASIVYQSDPVPASEIVDGTNTFRVDKTAERPTLGVLLDWFTVEYNARYKAKGNVLAFNSGSLTGRNSLVVTGLSRTDVMLFDVTDPLQVREYGLTPGHLPDVGNGYALAFREDLSGQKSYVVTTTAGIRELPASDVVASDPSQIIGGSAEAGVDILVVSHADFIDEMQRWVNFRKAQGYRVLMVDVADVYDEFNGGVANPRAIKKFIRHFFEKGGASFVVLVGDASEDNKHSYPESGENFVPTESYSERVRAGFDEDEVVTTDKWYAMLDYDFITNQPPGEVDLYPDVMIGRLPVGSAQELRYVLDKIIKFEQPAGDEFWRRRVIRVADNAFSGGFELEYRSSEEWFETAEENAAKMFEEAMPGGFDIVRFYLADKLENVEPEHVPGSKILGSILINETRDNVTPELINELNEGASIVSFQSHMNRYLVAHEWLFTSSNTYGIRDHTRFTNFERPWVLFGMGCHMSDYALHKERSNDNLNRNPPNGDALGELILLQRDGAVATYASTGYEYLQPNVLYTPIITEAYFDSVPTDTMIASNKAQARWILGETMMVAEYWNLVRNPFGSGDGAKGQIKRFHLLGDPVLRVDGGPPRFDVTVNGGEFHSGETVSGGDDDRILVRAKVSDEVAIEKLTLEIDKVDSTEILTVTPLVDENLSAAREYEISFEHQLQAKNYEIILRASQAEDTTAGSYHMVSEFIFEVQAFAELMVNGRPVDDGDLVPPRADYVFKLELPIMVDESLLRVETDGEAVEPVTYSHPTPEDSTTWLASFSQELTDGSHEVVLYADDVPFPKTVIVGSRAGLLDMIAYPNPFVDEVYFVFTNELPIADGAVDVFTVSGKKVAHIEIPVQSRSPGQNAVRWDGRTYNGDEVANGVYLYVATVSQNGEKITQRGKLVHVK